MVVRNKTPACYLTVEHELHLWNNYVFRVTYWVGNYDKGVE